LLVFVVIPEGNLLMYLFVILSAANGVPGQLAGWGRKNSRISLWL
jgi:hypothetical protein